ncbi:MAG: bacteriohemerythrin [bacterium]
MFNTKFIEWKERYSVGHDDLDEDHQEIISIINDLWSILKAEPTPGQVLEILDRLLEYTETHFQREQQVMVDHQYPDLVRHKGLHSRMVQRTRELHAKAVSNHSEISEESMTFLKDWWIDHILAQDSRYKPYILGTAVK